MSKPASILGKAMQFSDMAVVVAVVLIVVMMVLPLPPALLDVGLEYQSVAADYPFDYECGGAAGDFSISLHHLNYDPV